MSSATIVSAVVSIIAALLALAAARQATRGARALASLNHQIAALDTEAQQFRDDYRGFHEAQGNVTGTDAFGPLLAAGEILQANPRCGDKLQEAVDTIRAANQNNLKALQHNTSTALMMLPDEAFNTMRVEFRAALDAIALERAALVTERDRPTLRRLLHLD